MSDRDTIRAMLARLTGGHFADERMTYLEWADTGGPTPEDREPMEPGIVLFTFDDDGRLVAVEGRTL